MAYISCSVSTCGYNKKGTCHSSGGVNIGGRGATNESETCCGSFLNSNVYSNFSSSGALSEASYIACSADTCRHNSSGGCQLGSIQVGAVTNAKYYTETECLSFEQ